MEHTGLEPVTSTLPVWRAPNCANAPWDYYSMAKEKINTNFMFPFLYSVSDE